MNLLPQFTRSFAEQQFFLKFCPDKNYIVYSGNINETQFGNLLIDFIFVNRRLDQFPKAFILDHSHKGLQPYHFPHLDGNWEICFHDGTKIFDKYNAKAMVNFCVKAVGDVIRQGKCNDTDEIAPEFLRYWSPNVDPEIFYGNIDHDASFVEIAGNKIFSSKENTFGLSEGEFSTTPIFRIEELPSLGDVEWPIDKLDSLKIWLSYSPAVYTSICRYIKIGIANYNTVLPVVLAIEKYNFYFGLIAYITDPLLNKRKKPHLQTTTIEIILRKAVILKRFWIQNYSGIDLIKANGKDASELSLLNKRILLIGAGTIGSNLANILIRSGAGVGPEGVFLIVDHDIYEPSNYSRHFLGMKKSGELKADALVSQLQELAPFCNIVSLPTSIFQYNFERHQNDIIIDTTGEESLTIWLNEVVREKKIIERDHALVLSVWIQGAGESVESFSMYQSSMACHQCFRGSKYSSRDIHPHAIMRDSCRSVFIPFPISASLYAALLCIDVIHKWLRNPILGFNHSRQKIEPVGAIEYYLIDKDQECMGCGKNYITG